MGDPEKVSILWIESRPDSLLSPILFSGRREDLAGASWVFLKEPHQLHPNQNQKNPEGPAEERRWKPMR